MRKIRNQRQVLENNRWSVFTDNLKECYFCKSPDVELHELIYGSNRWNSMRYGYVLPLCRQHHNSFHKNHRLTMEWQVKCQEHFTNKYSLEEWLHIFHCNYKERLKQKIEKIKGDYND